MRESEEMTPRERIRSTLHFKKVDVLPWYESFAIDTVLRWFTEGLPIAETAKVEWRVRWARNFLNWPDFAGFDLYPYFGVTNLRGVLIPLDGGPVPRFKQRRISETDRYQEVVMETGVIARRLKERYAGYTMPMFTEFPVKDRKSWEKYKERLKPDDPRRYPPDWEKDVYLKLAEEHQGGATTLYITGFYGFGAELMGIPNFNLAFYKDPELIRDMVSYWEVFNIERVRDVVETFQDRIDMIFWWEDMAAKHGPNISPKLYREFLLPHYKKVTGFVNKNKIDRIMMDSDGNIYPLLDLIIEAGITGLWPLEVNSGMDARKIREKYGTKLFLVGNIDKRVVAKGGDAMKAEVDAKIDPLKETRGYIPGLDHVTPLDLSYQKFVEYADYIKTKLVA